MMAMEDNKDFEKEHETEQDARSLDDIMGQPVDEGDDGEKKLTVTLFGHEFGKKKVIMAGLGGLLVLALAGGGIAYALSQQHQPKDPDSVVQVNKKDEATKEWVLQLGVKADGWEKDKSSPVIAHIMNEGEGIDYYHAYDANADVALDVFAEDGYEVSFISPVNADGSTYKVPDKTSVEAEIVEEGDGEAELPFTFEPVKAEDMNADGISGIVSAVNEAVKKGDETLTGENGVKVVELVGKNLKANPNADEEKVEEQSDKAAETAQSATPADKGEGTKKQDTGSKGTASNGSGSKPSSKPSTGSGNSSSSSKPSGGSGSGSGNSKPSHTHNWVAQTKTVHHDAQYKTVHHDAEYKMVHHDAVIEYHTTCNKCGIRFNSQAEASAHMKEYMLKGDTGHSYGTNPVEVSPAWDEQVLVKEAWDEKVEVSSAWDETITTGYKCSCGATK